MATIEAITAAEESKLTTSAGYMQLSLVYTRILSAQRYLWCILCLLGVPGNILTILVVAKNQRLQTATNVLLAALATADLAVGVTGIVYQLIREHLQICGAFYDATLEIFVAIPLHSATFHVLLVAVDRYVAIVCPLRYEAVMTTGLIKKLVGLVWISLLCLTSTFYIWAVRRSGSCFAQVPFEHSMSMNVVLYISTASFLVFMYVRITLIARKHAKQIQQRHSPGLTRKVRQNNKTTRMLYFVLTAYFMSWTPYSVLVFVQFCAQPEGHNVQVALGIAAALAAQLGVANSGINFLIYAWNSKAFRKEYLKFVKCHCRKATHDGITPQGSLAQTGMNYCVHPTREAGKTSRR